MPGYTFDLQPEEDQSDFELSGTCTLWESVPERKSKLIRTDQDWGVTFNWSTAGNMAGSLAGDWHLRVYLEKMGPGDGPPVNPVTKKYETTADPQDYSESITIQKGTVPPGLYKVTAAITMTGPDPNHYPTPIAMMGEGPLIQVYKV